VGGHEGLLHGEERFTPFFCEPDLMFGDGRRTRSHPGPAGVGRPATRTTSASPLVASRLLVVGPSRHLTLHMLHVLRPCHAKSPTLVSVSAQVSRLRPRTWRVYVIGRKKRKFPSLRHVARERHVATSASNHLGSSGENVRRAELRTLLRRLVLHQENALGER
jgi:hypothetical protein